MVERVTAVGYVVGLLGSAVTVFLIGGLKGALAGGGIVSATIGILAVNQWGRPREITPGSPAATSGPQRFWGLRWARLGLAGLLILA